MKKILAVLLFFSSCFSIVYAQPKIQKSESLGSPVNPSYYKVLLLKNGNTALINCDGVGTFDVFLYGKDRKQLARQSVKNLEWDADDLRNTSFDGTYEINGEIVVFLQQQEKKRTVLYRMRINGETGKMIKDEAIAETRYTNFAFKMHNARATFNVAKDPASDYYSVVYYDNLTEEDENAIRVMYFDGQHNKINNARFTSPDKNIKDVVFKDAVVVGDKGVFIATYFLGSDDQQSKVDISVLKPAGQVMTTKKLDFTEDFDNTELQMAYNASSGKLQVLIATFVKARNGGRTQNYLGYLAYLDPATLDVAGVTEISNQKINEYARLHLSGEKEFTGMPQAMVIDNARKETILLRQAITVIVTQHTSSDSHGNSHHYTTITSDMGDIGISRLANDGNEKDAYLVPHKFIVGGEVGNMYLKDLSCGKWQCPRMVRHLRSSSQDRPFRMLSVGNTDYFIFEDYNRRLNEGVGAHLGKKEFTSKKANTALYTVRNGNFTEAYLFGKPEGKKQRNNCYMECAAQNETGTFASIMVAHDHRKNDAYLVWVDFQ